MSISKLPQKEPTHTPRIGFVAFAAFICLNIAVLLHPFGINWRFFALMELSIWSTFVALSVGLGLSGVRVGHGKCKIFAGLILALSLLYLGWVLWIWVGVIITHWLWLENSIFHPGQWRW